MSAATPFTVALKTSFDHCAGRRSWNASAFRPALSMSSATRRASASVVPRNGPIHVARVEDVLDVVVAVARPAHEGDGGEERPVAVRGDDLLGAEPVLDRHHRRVREPPCELRGERLEVGALAREDRELGVLRQVGRIGRRGELRGEVGAAGDAQAVLAQRRRVLLAPRQHRHVGDAREMPGEERADRAGAGDDDLSRPDLGHGSVSSRPPLRPAGRRMSTSAISTPSTISRSRGAR